MQRARNTKGKTSSTKAKKANRASYSPSRQSSTLSTIASPSVKSSPHSSPVRSSTTHHRIVRTVSSTSNSSKSTVASRRTMSFNAKDLSPNVLKAEYAVRGELVIKADKYREQLKSDPESLPFDKIIACNIGNPHELGQKPITFLRQVLALAHYPDMIENETIRSQFPEDAVDRAKSYLSTFSSTGSYTHSKGLAIVRKEVAQFIADRDGFTTDPDNVFLTDGASSGVKMLLQTLIRNNKDAVLTPIPQYPLYSASLALLDGQLAGYYLSEEDGWSMSVDSLKKSYEEAKGAGHSPRALVVINPGNPTGQSLPENNIRDIVKFCKDFGLVILADEVYQSNIYRDVPFTSFRKVVKEMQSDVPLVSFHSVSKGFLGECGQRGGYFHLTNFPGDVKDQLYKLASISLCSNVSGQLAVGVMVNPPKAGSPSHQQYIGEKDAILSSLQRRAEKLANALNELEGVNCQPVAGALYAFPSITLPPKAIEAAKEAGKAPDTFYALNLLDATGICVVPGTGFKQVEGTFHYRTTILPAEAEFDDIITKMTKFHGEFMDTYRS